LTLGYRDYLLLLKSAEVVITMSKFLEGWNITAHEAMLCKTPVIGSGKGGMRELLEGGRQIICEDFSRLPEMVELAIRESERLGNDGFEYAKNFTRERFRESWQTLVGDLTAGEPPSEGRGA
jgi:glycosyltransferase involved in cell wall biosynthesis